MNSGFWQQLARPIIGLSPMDGVTDFPFREITKKYGNPAIIYTEFTSVEGVCHGAKQLLKDFLYGEIERPVIGQIYGTTPDFFRQTAIVLCQLGFGLVAGYVAAKTQRIDTMQNLPLLERAGIEGQFREPPADEENR